MSSMTEHPNNQRWLKKAYWHLNEAVSLLLGIEPGKISDACRDPSVYDEYLACFIHHTTNI